MVILKSYQNLTVQLDHRVLTISVHNSDAEASQFDKIGELTGKGFNVNIPLDQVRVQPN